MELKVPERMDHVAVLMGLAYGQEWWKQVVDRVVRRVEVDRRKSSEYGASRS